jgi:hypothetical protein
MADTNLQNLDHRTVSEDPNLKAWVPGEDYKINIGSMVKTDRIPLYR